MVAPCLIFNGECEEAFNLYAKAFGDGKTSFVRLNNDPYNPNYHARGISRCRGCLLDGFHWCFIYI